MTMRDRIIEKAKGEIRRLIIERGESLSMDMLSRGCTPTEIEGAISAFADTVEQAYPSLLHEAISVIDSALDEERKRRVLH